MAYIIKRFNEEVLASNDDKDKVVAEILEKYNFTLEETDEQLAEYNGAIHTESYIAKEEEAIYNQKVAKFNTEFFNTSLGYVRRKVTMSGTGETETFLSDVLPLLEVGTPILVYNFLATEQTKVTVTQEFIDECKQQKLKDFYPVVEVETEEE